MLIGIKYQQGSEALQTLTHSIAVFLMFLGIVTPLSAIAGGLIWVFLMSGLVLYGMGERSIWKMIPIMLASWIFAIMGTALQGSWIFADAPVQAYMGVIGFLTPVCFMALGALPKSASDLIKLVSKLRG